VDTRERTQLRIAQEAARLMIEEGVEDHQRAKLKAAERLGLEGFRKLPRNEAIDAARLEFQRIYRARSQPEQISVLRSIAFDVMAKLEDFSPQLVGSLVDGSAGAHSPITIQVFPETPEDLIKALIEQEIPYRETSHIASLGKVGTASLPAVSFISGQSRVDILMFPAESIGKARARKHDCGFRANLGELRRLIEADAPLLPGEYPGLSVAR
jgi:hypothetical protein